MKLGTFIESNRERFGLVIHHPVFQEDWIFDPNTVSERLRLYASAGTSPLHATPPRFFDGPLPAALADFLSLGPVAMDQLRRFQDFLIRFMEQADQYILTGAGFPVASVKLLAPIPKPRLFLGLVQNSPTAWRSNPARTHLNLIPQGHQRPQTAILAAGETIYLPNLPKLYGGWNPELGVIIGKGGRDISVSDAREHIAGLTIVTDITYDYHRRDYLAQPAPHDWLEDATGSWGDKKADARTPVGPYLVTLDEIGNPYDLLIYTRENGLLRDRSHTGAMSLGIERTIHWLSTFRTLHPGDIIHMGTMGYDGSPNLPGYVPQEGHFIESEIEKIGTLRNPIIFTQESPQTDSTASNKRTIHPVAPAVQKLINADQTEISLSEWSAEKARHVWLVFGNEAQSMARHNLQPRPYMRFLCAPESVLTDAIQPVKLAPNHDALIVGCELAFVIRKLARSVPEAEAENYILGYAPLVSLYDTRFERQIIDPASPQEKHIPLVYGRWPDASNIIGAVNATPYPADSTYTLSFSTGESVSGAISEYVHQAAATLAKISHHITLLPGDVVSLGTLSHTLPLPTETPWEALSIHAEISGFAPLTVDLTS
jgi:2-keto-4-pentenoate hydratase/2-oxohepta-3-ene-1,7-dioic acid hydratase in catechol pathway